MTEQTHYSSRMELRPTPANLFFTKNDIHDPRLGEWQNRITQSGPRFNIFGYPDDEGIKLNGGRLGAAEAPTTIRQAFYKMTPDAKNAKSFQLHDLGDLDIKGPLADRHERGRNLVTKILSRQEYWISLGGGHDYGYCDSSAFVEANKDHKPLIVNFDAHLDVRPATQGYSSGTPFFRLMEEFHSHCSFIEVGLQPQCNSPHHAQWLMEKGGKILWRDEISKHGMLESLQKLVPLSIHPGFISVDLDCFSSSIAPGCSASWPSGLSWNEFTEAFDFLIEAFDIRGLGLYEVSPTLDQDSQTSKLAALIMHRFIFNTLKKENIP